MQLVEQLRSDAPANLDPGLLGTDGQVGVIQILNPRGMVVASSSDAPAALSSAAPMRVRRSA